MTDKYDQFFNFPNRPQHSDFMKLSEVILALDGEATEGNLSIPQIMERMIDPDSVVYMAEQRAKLVFPGASPQQIAAMTASFLNGFAAGFRFREKHRPAVGQDVAFLLWSDDVGPAVRAVADREAAVAFLRKQYQENDGRVSGTYCEIRMPDGPSWAEQIPEFELEFEDEDEDEVVGACPECEALCRRAGDVGRCEECGAEWALDTPPAVVDDLGKREAPDDPEEGE